MTYPFKTPFAVNGDKTDIPSSTTDGSISISTLWGSDYERNLLTDNKAKKINRRHMNYLFFIITEALAEMQSHGTSVWQESLRPYFKGSIVFFNEKVYVSQKNNNNTRPDLGDWKEILSDLSNLNIYDKDAIDEIIQNLYTNKPIFVNYPTVCYGMEELRRTIEYANIGNALESISSTLRANNITNSSYDSWDKENNIITYTPTSSSSSGDCIYSDLPIEDFSGTYNLTSNSTSGTYALAIVLGITPKLGEKASKSIAIVRSADGNLQLVKNHLDSTNAKVIVSKKLATTGVWNNYKDGVNITITVMDDVLTIKSTDFGHINDSAYDEIISINISDLTTDVDVEKAFNGGKFGFSISGTPAVSAFKKINRVAGEVIYNGADNIIATLNNNTGVSVYKENTDENILTPGLFYYNKYLGNLYYNDKYEGLIPLNYNKGKPKSDITFKDSEHILHKQEGKEHSFMIKQPFPGTFQTEVNMVTTKE